MKNFFLILIAVLSTVGVSFAQPAPQTASDFLKQGNAQLLQKNYDAYDAAAKSYSDCIRLEPNAAGCYRNRALALLEKSKLERESSEAAVKRFLDYDGVDVKNPTRIKALEDANKAVQILPKRASAYFTRGLIYAAEDLFQKAFADYQQGFVVEPNLATAKPAVYSAGKTELAKIEKQYVSWLGSRGRDAASRASDLEQAKDAAGAQKVRQQAIDYFTKSLELDKTSHLNWASRGDVYKYQKNYVAAIADYTGALKVKPDYAAAFVGRAEVYVEQKKPALALADYEKVIVMSVNFDTKFLDTKFKINEALVGRGQIRLDAGQTDLAIADFNKVLAENPKYMMAFFNRGKAHAKKKNKPQAIADFRQALAIAPKYSEAIEELKKLGVQP